MKTFNLKILAADKYIYDGPCKSLQVPIFDGLYGILPGHSAMLSSIKPGKIFADIDDKDFLEFIKNNNKNYDISNSKNVEGKFAFICKEGIISVNSDKVVIALSQADFYKQGK